MTKTPAMIYEQNQRIQSAIWARTTKRAAVAHPETGGNWNLVHNWGNAKAKAIWVAHTVTTTRVYAIYDRLYARAMLADPYYVQHHDCPVAV